jgi:hypothetical protein
MLDCDFYLLIRGDYNYVDNPDLDKIFTLGIPSIDKDSGSRKIFDEYKTVYGLSDISRFLYPTVKASTFYSKTHKSGSRLDRIYVNNSLLDFIINTEHVDVLWADHKAVKCTVKIGSNPRGPGYWKCNVSVFDDKFFNDDFIAPWDTLDNGSGGKFDLDWWEHCKFKSLIIIHCTRLAKIRKSKIKYFLRQIGQLKEFYPDDEEARVTLYDKYRSEIEHIMNFKLASVKLHNRTAHFENQDKPSKFLLSPNLCKNEKKDINSLKFNGIEYKDTAGILNVCRNYYSDLLCKVDLDFSELSEFLSNVPSIAMESRELCEGPITFNECKEPVAHMHNSKAPGCDGLPAELYFDVFGYRYVDCVNDVFYNQGLLTTS